MLSRRNLTVVIGALAVVFGLAASVQAAPALYTGSMRARMGNDLLRPRLNPIPGPTSASPGSASVTGSAPAAFTLPAGDFYLQTSYQNPSPTSPYLQSSTIGTHTNAAGSFFAGGGVGNTTFVATAPRLGTFVFHAGPNQFGGQMTLLGGTHNTFAQLTLGGGILFLDGGNVYLPRTGVTGKSPLGTTRVIVAPGVFITPLGQNKVPLTVTQTVTGAPWTTGTVTAIVTAGPFGSSIATTTGFDTRNAAGTTGNIQMVTGGLGHVTGSGDFAGIYRMSVSFLPEPGATAMLAAGILLLGAFYRRRGAR